MISLARILLNKKPLVLMDEATASIDNKTEAFIQEIIKTKFEGSTMIMIAHRLNTILHCEKVVVMENGKVVEFGEVKVLANDKSSVFGKMLKKSDEINMYLS